MRVKILGKCWDLLFVRSLGKDEKGRIIDGECDPPSLVGKQIRVLNRLRGQDLLDTVIHEGIHAAGWHIDEEFVADASRDIARAIMKPEIRDRIFGAENT